MYSVGGLIVDNATIIFWLVCLYCGIGIYKTVQLYGRISLHSLFVYAGIMFLAFAGRFSHRDLLVYTAAVAWLLLVFTPGLLSVRCHRLALQMRYAQALRLSRIIRLLHPTREWRRQIDILRAFELADRGELAAALAILEPLKGAGSTAALNAASLYYRLSNHWEEFLLFETEHQAEFEEGPFFLATSLRARGETGDVRGLVELYQRRKAEIDRLQPATQADGCRLILFAFCGQKAAVEKLYRARMADLPLTVQKFWLATAELAAGETASAKQHLEELLPGASATVRTQIERRLAQIQAGAGLARDFDAGILAQAAIEQEHSETFRPRMSLIAPEARVTLILILLNAGMFCVEMWMRSSTDGETLFRLGGLYVPAVQGGQWWRVFTACFLHFGPLHLAMNMLSLWGLGATVEYALGARRFLFVYLLTGAGSMAVLASIAIARHTPVFAVGASGAVMGLVGVLGALLLRGWRRHRALLARNQLVGLGLLVALQTVVDAVVPNISMTAHVSGLIIGFLVTLLLRDRLGLTKVG